MQTCLVRGCDFITGELSGLDGSLHDKSCHRRAVRPADFRSLCQNLACRKCLSLKATAKQSQMELCRLAAVITRAIVTQVIHQHLLSVRTMLLSPELSYPELTVSQDPVVGVAILRGQDHSCLRSDEVLYDRKCCLLGLWPVGVQ